MTRGTTSNKQKTLGRLIFGDKRKQHASPSRHRSASRNPSNTADISTTSGRHAGVASKSPLNVHDWAVWRMQLNEHLANGAADKIDPKYMRQYLQSSQFYQQHSRDPSNGRFSGTRLLFSIPHTKLKPDYLEHIHNKNHAPNPKEVSDNTVSYSQTNSQSVTDDRKTMNNHPISSAPPINTERIMSPTISKGTYAKTDEFIRVNEHIIANEPTMIRSTARNSYCAADRVHSTLQKAVKDGNVLEKIKAFEMQAAAAAQADSTTKLSGNLLNHRVQPISSSIPINNHHRTLSPLGRSLMSNPITPVPHSMVAMPSSPNLRSHRSRHGHSMSTHRRDGHSVPSNHIDSRKGAHVLEPAHGDIILKRRTPSQAGNDEDYSTTIMSSIAQTASHNHHRSSSRHHHRQHQHQQQQHRRRTSASRSRVRQESTHERRTNGQKEKSHSKKKDSNTPTEPAATTKTSSRYRWLKGRKETPTENKDEETKSKKTSKSKKKQTDDKDGAETKKKSKDKNVSADNNRVYGVPNVSTVDETKSDNPIEETKMPNEETNPRENPHEEEEEETGEEKNIYMIPKDEEMAEEQVQRRVIKPKSSHAKLSSTDGEILDKIEEDARFSRPTDDHAHRSDLIDDDDDQSKSEGDVFIEEPSMKSTSQIATLKSNTNEKNSSERRWHWSKESGGLIEKGNRKKSSTSSAIRPNESIPEEVPKEEDEEDEGEKSKTTERVATPTSPKVKDEQIAHSTAVDEFFENGPLTNPEETLAKLNHSA